MSLYEIKFCKEDRYARSFGCVIENNSGKSATVEFLGMHNRTPGVEVSNMFTEDFMDDNSFTMLKNYILACGRVDIAVTRISADDSLHRALNGGLGLIDRDNYVAKFRNINLDQFRNPYQQQSNVVEIIQNIVLTWRTALEVTINAGYRIAITMFPKRAVKMDDRFSKEYDDMVVKNSEYNATKRKRYALLF